MTAASDGFSSHSRPASIRLFLADGSPDGLWVVQKSNWTGVALMAPRSRYATLRARAEIAGPGVYVLVGPADRGVKSARVYIGETDVLRDRLDTHQRSKDFWTRVVVFTSKDENLNKAHVRYLESRLIRICVDANRVEIENGGVTALPSLSEADRADMEAFLDDMLLIYPVLGVNAFENVSAPEGTVDSPRLHLSGKDAKADGQEAAEGFVVFKGARARRDTVPSVHNYIVTQRANLIAEGVLDDNGAELILNQDYVFSSPSNAAMVLMGRTANGRLEWKNDVGITLKQLQERSVDA